jgi:hypothetical protein
VKAISVFSKWHLECYFIRNGRVKEKGGKAVL